MLYSNNLLQTGEIYLIRFMTRIKMFALLFALLFFNSMGGYAQKLSKVDSLKNLLVTVGELDKANVLNKLCWKLRNSYPEEAVEYGKLSIILSKQYNNYEELAKAYGFSGVAYRNLGNYSQAFDSYFEGLKISQKHKLKEQEGYALINIGNLYIYQESYDDAIQYLEKAVIIANEIDNTKMIAYCNLNIGRALLLKNNFSESLNYLQKTLKIRKELNDKEGEATCLKYIADSYLGQNKIDSSYTTYILALSTTVLSDNDLLSDIYSKLAEISLLKRNFKDAENYAKKSLDEAVFVESKLRIRNSYQILYNINIELKRYKEASEFSKLIVLYNDSLFNQTLSQKILNIKYSAENEANQAEIDFLNKEKQINANDLKRLRRFQIILVTIVIIMFLLIILGVVLRNRLKTTKEKKEELLEANNKLLEEEKLKLQEDKKDNNNRIILANIVDHSLNNNLSLNDFLQIALNEIISISWLNLKVQGAIFLTNKDGNLEMVAEKNIGELRLRECSTVNKGECICGEAVAKKKSFIGGEFRSKFELNKKEIPHIHFKNPIILGNEVLGLLNLYVGKDVEIREKDINFLGNICYSLAQIIKQKQLQISLEEQKTNQNILNQKLFAQSLEVEQQNINIASKNSELSIQKEELQATVDALAEAKNRIIGQHKNITDSINYAKNIQSAMLTNNKIISTYFAGGHFILFKPKETVSGDFYYVNKVDDNLIFSVADCTGHGVPGGFITILGITYLHDIIRRTETDTPGEVLNILRLRIKEIFKTFGNDNNNGLDIAFCAVNTKTNVLQYAGAYNPLWIIRNSELIEIKATRNPIGFYPKEKPFKNNEIQLQNNDKIYIFTDGYQDQFGTNNKKFTSKRFKQLIISVSHLPMPEQNDILLNTLKDWQGDTDQIDDITVMGIEWKL